MKNLPPLLLAVLLAAVSARADEAEDEEQGAAASRPAAAAAARDKGYQAEEAPEAATTGAAGAAPDAAPASAPRPKTTGIGVGQGPASFSRRPGATSGGSPVAAGISCEKTQPPLKNVHRRELDFFDKIHRGNVIRFAMPPRNAAVWRFTSPTSGEGIIVSDMGTFATPVPVMMTVSKTPCDFDVAKAEKQSGCHRRGGDSGTGIAISIGKPKSSAPTCVLKPDEVYYMSIRFLSPPPEHDTCDDVTHKEKKCGGIWQAHGNFKWKDAAKLEKAVDFKVNNSANIGWQP
ncbi:MAG: hypothetical protein M0D55_04970 [Elusimicrobiota bacterium]|nr:MAG: hypothetical protein M0D55_04970 [Elusimicrobiota bacterium]